MQNNLKELTSPRTDFVNLFYSMRAELNGFLQRKLSDINDAEDVTQELFVVVSRLDDATIMKLEEPRLYIYRIANNLAIAVLKKKIERKQFTAPSVDYDNIVCSSSSPETIFEANQRAALLKSAIASMPPNRRTIFLLYRFSKMSRTQIAEELDMTVDTVHKNITRALKHCNDWVSRGEA